MCALVGGHACVCDVMMVVVEFVVGIWWCGLRLICDYYYNVCFLFSISCGFMLM